MSVRTVAQVAGNPDPSQLPGGQVLQQLTNGIMGWALILALVVWLQRRRAGPGEGQARREEKGLSHA